MDNYQVTINNYPLKTESNRIEYKRELTDDLEKEVVAFLNYRDGGVIYIGIDKIGVAVGVAECDEVQLKIKNRLRDKISPSTMGLFDVVVEQIDGKEIIKVTVASGLEKPYHLKRKLLNQQALHEAVINAIIHNDYSNEVPPKFELFSNRLEITSAGGIPQGLSESDFFMGYSVPQNKELIRVFRDLDMVEQLGSGIPRILAHYPQTIYHFTPNFIRLVIPYADGFDETVNSSHIIDNYPLSTGQATGQAEKLLEYCKSPRSTKEMMDHLGVNHREHFRDTLLLPLVESGHTSLTIPDKPKSPKQRYVTARHSREGGNP